MSFTSEQRRSPTASPSSTSSTHTNSNSKGTVPSVSEKGGHFYVPVKTQHIALKPGVATSTQKTRVSVARYAIADSYVRAAFAKQSNKSARGSKSLTATASGSHARSKTPGCDGASMPTGRRDQSTSTGSQTQAGRRTQEETVVAREPGSATSSAKSVTTACARSEALGDTLTRSGAYFAKDMRRDRGTLDCDIVAMTPHL